MIAMILKNGRTGPVVMCDHCMERIANPSMAMVCWDYPDGDDQPTGVYHLHKNECDRAFNQGRQRPWEEMSRHILYLAYNVGMTIEAMIHAEDTSKEMREAGL